MVKLVKAFDGTRTLPVTDAFYAQNYLPHDGMEELTQAENAGERARLLRLSDLRNRRGTFFRCVNFAGEPYASTLTQTENDLLAALTNVFNMHTAVEMLGDTPHTDFGFEGADQVHHNTHHMQCGCKLRSVFDHHLRNTGKAKSLPHTPAHTCDAHPLAAFADHKAHFHAVHAAVK